jgi:DNA-directed RNA polymerase subunit RPC12/RpoP
MDRPLLLAQRKKLVVGASLLAVSALVCLFSESVGGWIGVSSGYVGLAGALVLVVLLFTLARALRCPRCRVNLFFYALGHAKSANWLDWLLNQSVCPKCGYRQDVPGDRSC